MTFVFGKVTADIDADATRLFYKSGNYINDCSCAGCCNFRAYAAGFDEKIKSVLSAFGIDDPNFIAEIIPFDTSAQEYEKRGGLVYGGFYHAVGKTGGEKFKFEETAAKLTDNFEIFLSPDISLLPEGFPRPAVQIEIFAHIPWVIPEENTYIIK